MKKLHLAVVLGLTAGTLFWAFGPATIIAEEKETKVAVGDLPEAVRATLEKEAPGAAIEEIEMEEEDGKVVYEIEVKIDGKEVDLEIAADGTLLEKEVDDEQDDDGDDEDDDDDDDDDDEDDDDEDDDDEDDDD